MRPLILFESKYIRYKKHNKVLVDTSSKIVFKNVLKRVSKSKQETKNVKKKAIDKKAGVINFSSNMANELCILEYISDGMEGGDDSLISVNKLFEKYVYAYIQAEILSSKLGVQEYVVMRARKEKSALLRNAKIRMSNIHPGRLLLNLRGMDKWIK
jgi:hypothetical protein